MFSQNRILKLSLIVICIMLTYASLSAGQSIQIIKLMGKHAAIDKGEGYGLILGDTYQIIRSSMGRDIVIGEARIKAIRSQFSAIEITQLKSNYKLMVGDKLSPLYSEDTIIYNAPLASNTQTKSYGRERNLSFPQIGLKEYGGGASIQVIKESSVFSIDGLIGYYIKPDAKIGFRAFLQKIEGAPTFGAGLGEYSHYFNTHLPTPVKPYVGVVLGLADNGKDIKAAIGCHVGINISRPSSKWSNRLEIFLMNADASILGFRIGFSVFQ